MITPNQPDRYDAIVIGAGHNGMTTAWYLADAGARVLVVEAREQVGGMATTEEIWPGYFAEPAAQIAHGIEPRVFKDMGLDKYGLELERPNPYLVMPYEDGTAFVAHRRRSDVEAALARISEKDAGAWFEYQELLQRIASDLAVSPLEPPLPVAELFRRAEGIRDREAFYELMFGTIESFLSSRFESPQVRAIIGVMAVAFNFAGPKSSSGYLLLHWALAVNSKPDFEVEDDYTFRGGAMRPKGGIGALTRVLGQAAVDRGVEIRLSTAVERLEFDGTRCIGVRLADDTVVHARAVVSNVEPVRTLRGFGAGAALSDEANERLAKIKHNGSICKVLVAVDGEPRFKAAGSTDENRAFLRSSFRIAPSLDYIERAYDDAKYGRPSEEPVIFGQCPTAIDPTLAPAGKHILGLTVFHAPYHLSEGTWDTVGDKMLDRVLDVLAKYFVNIPERVDRARIITPVDIERTYGSTHGSPTHGDLTFARLWSAGAANPWDAYRSAVEGLYLCGSGTWPGGAVTAASGHNAAQVVLTDLDLSVT